MVKKATTKKKVSEKKTKETYTSKAAMMKHEKGESKKMKIKEGELPTMKKGGKMSCNCGEKDCMKCGGTKKYKKGGKTATSKKKIVPAKGTWVPPWIKTAKAKK